MPSSVAPGLTYTVTYTFDGRGIPDGLTKVTDAMPLQPAKYIYGDADTKVTVKAGDLAKGIYEVTAVVTVSGGWPVTAFIDLAVLEIF
jgi:hypothetical protein